MESALGMLPMSGNLKLSRLHLSRALSLATLIDDTEPNASNAPVGITGTGCEELNRAAMLFETADRQSQTIGAIDWDIWF